MKCTDLRRNFQAFVDTFTQFADCFIRIGNNDDLFRIDMLFFYKIFDLCCHRGRFTGACSGNEQAIVIIGDNGAALFFVKFYNGIDVLENIVKIRRLTLEYLLNIIGIMSCHIAVNVMHPSEKAFQYINVNVEFSGVVANILKHHFVYQS